MKKWGTIARRMNSGGGGGVGHLDERIQGGLLGGRERSRDLYSIF